MVALMRLLFVRLRAEREGERGGEKEIEGGRKSASALAVMGGVFSQTRRQAKDDLMRSCATTGVQGTISSRLKVLTL